MIINNRFVICGTQCDDQDNKKKKKKKKKGSVSQNNAVTANSHFTILYTLAYEKYMIC